MPPEPTPLVSVIMPFLDAQTFIGEAVESVFAQTLGSWELILVDDGSTDGSTAFAKDLAARHAPRVRYVDHPGHQNRGISASRNLGVSVSAGRFIAFLDADDVWMPEKLAQQVQILQERPDVALVCGATLVWHSWDASGAGGRDEVVLTGNLSDQVLVPPAASLSLYPLAPTPGASMDLMVRREVLLAVGGFEERFRGMFEDQAFLAKIYLDYPIYISGTPWFKYRQHPASCVASSVRESTKQRSREAFFDWFESYLAGRSRPEPAVVEALRAARRRTVPHRLSASPLGRLARVVRRFVPRLPGRAGLPG